YYDIGYRLIKRFWGKGFATESAIASLQYGFEKLELPEIFGTVDMDNIASRNVLIKSGLKYVETFDFEGYPCGWYKISKEDWLSRK
ncbi:MAG: GNAT family N-acetyltransferase, partial [Candidatus Kapaibacterium sp.]